MVTILQPEVDHLSVFYCDSFNWSVEITTELSSEYISSLWLGWFNVNKIMAQSWPPHKCGSFNQTVEICT